MSVSHSPPLTDPAASAPRRSCAFLVAGRCFAVDAASVIEVLRSQAMTPVPRAHRAIRGLLNLRGRIVPAIDMRYRLGLTDMPADKSPTNIVLVSGGELFSLLVDELIDVIDIPAVAIEQPTAVTEHFSRDAIEGVFAGPNGLVHLLSIEAIVSGVMVSTANESERSETHMEKTLR